ncbi:MAG TPA: spore coat protein [Firmicutes bacterium]|nr:spore coat protein [Bacillota bacterium]
MPQDNKTIQNPQSGTVPKVKGPQINDRDILNDVLATEKYLTDNFNVFAREASYPALYNDVENILCDTHKAARDAFLAMFQRGWYKLEGVEQQKLQQAQQQFSSYLGQFPYPDVLQ